MKKHTLHQLTYHFRSPISCLVLCLLACLSLKPTLGYGFEVHGLTFPPYIFVEKDGDAQGIIVDMVEELAVRLGEPVSFNISNWARAYRVVTTHKSDALIPTMKTPERLKYLHYPETPLLYLTFHLVSLKDNRHTFSGNFKDLSRYKVGRLRSAKVSPGFDKALSEGIFTVQERNSTKLLIKGVVGKRLDFIALDWRVARWEEVAMFKDKKLEAMEPALGRVPVYLAFSNVRYTREKVAVISKELSKMHDEGVLERLEQKYFGREAAH